MAYPVVGDVAKLDMLNIHGLATYPVVGDVAKLDICPRLFVPYSFLWDSKQYTL